MHWKTINLHSIDKPQAGAWSACGLMPTIIISTNFHPKEPFTLRHSVSHHFTFPLLHFPFSVSPTFHLGVFIILCAVLSALVPCSCNFVCSTHTHTSNMNHNVSTMWLVLSGSARYDGTCSWYYVVCWCLILSVTPLSCLSCCFCFFHLCIYVYFSLRLSELFTLRS